MPPVMFNGMGTGIGSVLYVGQEVGEQWSQSTMGVRSAAVGGS